MPASRAAEWQIEPDENGRSGGPRTNRDPLVTLFQGPDGDARAEQVRRRLTQALDLWWTQAQMPSRTLLRDALLALEAGHRFDEAQTTLLLRAALFYGRGMLTALHHQGDPERTASVMRDMLLDPRRPLAPAQIVDLARQDEEPDAWLRPLRRLLREEASQALEPRRTLAAAALAFFDAAQQNGVPLAWTPLAQQQVQAPHTPRPQPARSRRRPRRRLSPETARLFTVLFLVMALALALIAGALFWLDWQQRFDPTGEMISLPGGVYTLLAPEAPGGERRVELRAFAIDRTEVTNRAYRLCFQADACTWPKRTTSTTRPDYFLNPNLDNFPMINVDWNEAAAFCAWAGKRLPLEEEWAVAAGSALTLQRGYLYPWGDIFEVSLANSARSNIGDTLPVGTFSPGGDSPSGAADMAGNVAEWTATPGDLTEPEPSSYVVKGGSFADPPEQLTVPSRRVLAAEERHPWLGFRCARTLP